MPKCKSRACNGHACSGSTFNYVGSRGSPWHSSGPPQDRAWPPTSSSPWLPTQSPGRLLCPANRYCNARESERVQRAISVYIPVLRVYSAIHQQQPPVEDPHAPVAGPHQRLPVNTAMRTTEMVGKVAPTLVLLCFGIGAREATNTLRKN